MNKYILLSFLVFLSLPDLFAAEAKNSAFKITIKTKLTNPKQNRPAKKLKRSHDNKINFEVVCFSSMDDESSESCEYLDNTRYIVIPKKSYIDEQINQVFITYLYNLSDYVIKPFNTSLHQNSVNKLPEFKEDGMKMPIMEQGYVRCALYIENGQWDQIDHGYIICSKDNEKDILGALCCAYSLDQNIFKLEAVGVKTELQGQGLGAALVELAIFIASLYDSAAIELQSTELGLMNYAKHGFWFYKYNDDDECEYAHWRNLKNLDSKKLKKIGLLYDFNMKLDFNKPEQLDRLDEYMIGHGKIYKVFSELIKANMQKTANYKLVNSI